ncbi:hypothetical protein UAY_03289 [Enterococcus moraviensis ATCC BAA-383]|uniref:Lipoprotein n=1 Tax=Enterococcus moraviensis ATCC BAA-383 TaxID=1158609 RepID=R2QL10_9ENTE|nr:hypothetical protein [Enterococcus moraviensis]EOH95863.1 hypothetical protein UAY_03289 [Enterococcus moraviensis ATCC BAA-383]EOT66350.1 hypothetical protein I586_02621 [Enterococcus moraviensis ATCC BAA-383]OJG67586.1 hypothetical protein RV09_GL002355 [Enterococcus moraviensis]
MKKLFLLVIPVILLAACGSSTDSASQKNEQSASSSSSAPITNNSSTKTLTGRLTVGKDGDLEPGTYDLKAVDDGYGTVTARTSDDKPILREHMASLKGKENYKKNYVKDGDDDSDLYHESVTGMVVKEGDTVRVSKVSVEFTKVD